MDKKFIPENMQHFFNFYIRDKISRCFHFSEVQEVQEVPEVEMINISGRNASLKLCVTSNHFSMQSGINGGCNRYLQCLQPGGPQTANQTAETVRIMAAFYFKGLIFS